MYDFKRFVRLLHNSANLSHYGNFGFAYEEWNFGFDPRLFRDEWQYGWVEGFADKPRRLMVPAGSHYVALYTYTRNTQKYHFAGKLKCENLMPQG